MITFIQTVYKIIFNSIFAITKNIPQKCSDIIVKLSLFALAGMFFFQCGASFVGLNPRTDKERMVVIVGLIVILCIFSVKEKLRNIKWNPWVVYPYYIAAVTMVITGYHHPVGDTYLEYAWTMLLLFPALYFILNNNREYDKYADILAKSISIQGVVIVVLTYLLRPINEVTFVGERYVGLSTNPNFLGMIGIIVTGATLYLIATAKKKVPIYIILNGIFVAFVWLSVARTALIAVVLQCIAWTIMMIRLNFREQKSRTLILICITFIVLVIAIPLVQNSLTFAGKHIAPIGSAEETVKSEPKLEERLDLEHNTVAQISSGRDLIWKECVKYFNLVGNDYERFSIEMPSGAIIKNIHNTYIDISFRSGIIAGGAYLVFITAVLAVMNINIFNNRNKKYMIFTVMIIIAYFIESVLEIQVLPFNRGGVLLFYLTLAPIWDREFLKER